MTDDGVTSDTYTPTLESGPTFHVDERVLCTDSRRAAGRSVGTKEPLFEAIIRQSDLKHVDPRSGKISGLQDHHDVNIVQRQWCHLIHWQGWNARWDRWRTEAEVFRDTPENRERVEVRSGKIFRAPSKTKDEDKRRKKKRSKEAKVGDGEDIQLCAGSIYQQNLQLVTNACSLPFTLQTILVDDSERITKKVYPPPSFNDNSTNREGVTMLHTLPGTMNIIDVLRQYVHVKKREDLEEFARAQERQREEDTHQPTELKYMAVDRDANNEGGLKSTASTNEHARKDGAQLSLSSKISRRADLKQKKRKRKRFALSIIALVDISLPLFLLYGEERDQFVKVIKRNAIGSLPTSGDEDVGSECGQEQTTARLRPSELYGAEHLLRLFVKLPHVISHYDPKQNEVPNSAADEEGDETYILASKKKSQEFAEHLKELVVFLQKNLDCFKGKYYAVQYNGMQE